MSPLAEPVPVETGALETVDGAEDSIGLEEAEAVAKTPEDADALVVGFESPGME